MRAALRPVRGSERVARFFAGLVRKGLVATPRWTRRLVINGLPGLAAVEPGGTLQTFAVEVTAGRIAAIYITRNPDKLAHVAQLVPDGIPRD